MFKYEVVKTIGNGAAGSVMLVRDKESHKLFAAKKCPLPAQSECSQREFHIEERYLSELVHPNIVSCRESFIEESHLYLVMEYASAGDLHVFINRFLQEGMLFPESVIRVILHDSLDALRCIHDHGVVHRDIKPSNILLFANGVTKVCDFGIAQPSLSSLSTKCTGTLQYMAPEVVNRASYTAAADVWSLGCVIYELMWRRPLFNEGSYSELVARIVEFKSTFHLEFPVIYSEELCDFVKCMLSIEPQERPSVKDLLEREYLRRVDSGGRSLLRYYAERETFRKEVKDAIESQQPQVQHIRLSELRHQLLFDAHYIQTAIKAIHSCNVDIENMGYNVSEYTE